VLWKQLLRQRQLATAARKSARSADKREADEMALQK
jgi:hypothetical protein